MPFDIPLLNLRNPLFRGFVPLLGPAYIKPSLAFARAQLAGVESTSLGLDGTTWYTSGANVARYYSARQWLLLEGQRTGLIANIRQGGAVAGTPGTLPTGFSRFGQPAGITVTVVGTGTTADGRVYVDYQWVGTPGATASGRLQFGAAQTATASQSWSMSCDVALVGGSLTNTTVALGWYENDSVPAFLRNGDNAITPTATLTRYVRSGTTGASTAQVIPNIRLVFTSGLAVDFTLRVVWPQIEQASFASTPILPPVAAPAASTRGADLLSGSLTALGIPASGACTIIGQAVIGQNATASANQTLVELSDGTTSNRYLFANPAAGAATLTVFRSTSGAGASSASAGSFTPGTAFAFGVTVDGAGRAVLTWNGNAVQAVTGGPTSGMTSIRFGNTSSGANALFDSLGIVLYSPRVLPDARAQAAAYALARMTT